MSAEDINAVYGDANTFFTEFSAFEEEYYKTLRKQGAIAKGKRVNVDLMRASGKIDLSVLNFEERQRLSQVYRDRVLKVNDLVARVGLPAYELPNANLFRDSVRFRTGESNGVVHPALSLLNRTIFSHDPAKAGVDSLGFSQQIISSRALRQSTQGIESLLDMSPGGAAKRIITFDVETTGVTLADQVRSMAMAEMEVRYDASGKLRFGAPERIKDLGLLFDSPRLAGMTVSDLTGSSSSMTEFFARSEFGMSAEEMRRAGTLLDSDQFLDGADKFLKKLLEADGIAGHNVGFDIDMIIRTAMDIAGENFGGHRIGATINSLYEKINKGNYLIDTLDITRNYLIDQVEELIRVNNITEIDEINSTFVKELYANETLAKVNIGGAASYASVENIALNTNLFTLIEEDGKAKQLFELLNKGSHIADTDTVLQSYVMEYVQTRRLKISGHSSNIGYDESEFVKIAKARISQSSAVTPTTSLADVRQLSSTVFGHIMQTEQGIRGVKISADSAELGIKPADLGIEEESVRGFVSFDSNTGKFVFSSSSAQIEIADQAGVEGIIKRILQNSAIENGSFRQVQVGRSMADRMRHQDADRIIDLGFSYQQISDIEEMIAINKSVSGLSTSVAPVSSEAVQQAFGSMYREFGTEMSLADEVRVAVGSDPIGSVFQAGFNNYTIQNAAEVAQKFANIGDPFSFLDVKSRVFSSVMADATARVGVSANKITTDLINSSNSARSLDSIAYSANPRLMSELGVSYAEVTRSARLFGNIADISNVPDTRRAILPIEIVEEAMSRAISDVDQRQVTFGLSFAQRFDGTEVGNVVMNLNRSISQDEALEVSSNILNIMESSEDISRLIGVEESELGSDILRAVNEARAVSGNEDAARKLADMIMANNVVVAGLGEETDVASLRMNLEKIGTATGNDVLMQSKAAVAVDRLGGGDNAFIALSPFMDERSARIAGNEAAISTASRQARDRYNAIAVAVSENESTIKSNIRRGKMGVSGNNVLDIYNRLKAKSPIIFGAAAALGAGYYVSKKKRERDLYSETVAQQDYEAGRGVSYMNDSAQQFIKMNSYRQDPLLTAGVVGNLDRNKVNHTRMGNNRYNHLFEGM